MKELTLIHKFEEDDDEIIIKVYLDDRSYRSMLLHANETAQTFAERISEKVGFSKRGMCCFFFSRRLSHLPLLLAATRFALFKFQYENERLVEPTAYPFDIIRKHIDNPPVWMFKELPDTEVNRTLCMCLSQSHTPTRHSCN